MVIFLTVMCVLIYLMFGYSVMFLWKEIETMRGFSTSSKEALIMILGWPLILTLNFFVEIFED
jgi:hypothetical protein